MITENTETQSTQAEYKPQPAQINEQPKLKPYSTPRIVGYGIVEKLTQTAPNNVDGQVSSVPV